MELSYDDVQKKILPDTIDIPAAGKPDFADGVIIGQERAVSALEFGLRMEAPGFNVYVSGTPGTGKMTSVRSFLSRLAQAGKTPSDLCCVYNFRDPYEPLVVRLEAGQGARLRADMEHLALHIREDLPRAFETEEYGTRKDTEMKELVKSREKFTAELSEKAKARGFLLQPTPVGLLVVPMKDGEPMSDEAVATLSPEAKQELEGRRGEFQKELKSGQTLLRRVEGETQERIRDLDRQVVVAAIGSLIDEIGQRFGGIGAVTSYLDAVREDILRNTDLFKTRQGERSTPVVPGMEPLPDQLEAALSRYRVNVMVDNSAVKGAPVVVELNPTYTNLVGRLEKELRMGAIFADFSLVRGGALAQANGGYLVLPAEDLLRNPLSWDALKRCLRSSELRIEEAAEQFGYLTLKTLRPQPVPLSVKVILVGSPELHHLLFSLDPEFPELFKVKAEFDTRMDRTDANVERFVSFAATLCAREKLRMPDRSAHEALLRYASRSAEHQDRISVHFAKISDIIREADYWAGIGGAPAVTSTHVKKAIEERAYRSSLLRDRIRELVEEGVIVLETQGRKTGQVNGLSVMSLGDFEFGRPNRITAVASPGREGIVDIERETKLGGPIHSKGVFILSGCMMKKYSGGRPVSLSAQIVFEQSYAGIEGDSASQAEFYALVSALSGIALRQDIAVTGSLDQFGGAQAIEGVNEKIEGFFDVCSTLGLTGSQGVIIPETNRMNLMLRDDVADSIRQGRFHVWTVKTVDEGLELLTGETAGSPREDGTYPIGTVNRKTGDVLKAWSDEVGEQAAGTRKRQDG